MFIKSVTTKISFLFYVIQSVSHTMSDIMVFFFRNTQIRIFVLFNFANKLETVTFIKDIALISNYFYVEIPKMPTSLISKKNNQLDSPLSFDHNREFVECILHNARIQVTFWVFYLLLQNWMHKSLL